MGVDANSQLTNFQLPTSKLSDNVDVGTPPGLNWQGIGIMATAPFVVGLLIAYLFWRRSEPIFGNIVGTGIIFSAAFGMIWREHVELDRIVQTCIEAGYTCWPEPSAFTRFAIYAFIGLLQVFTVFTISLKVEERIRRRDYAPEWREWSR